MNAWNRQKKWFDYCMDSTVLDRNGMTELRMTKDVEGYNNSMYVIIVYKCGGGLKKRLAKIHIAKKNF